MSNKAQKDAMYCIPAADGHCITCSDEALPATVLRIDQANGSALVTVGEATEEIDVTLVDDLAPGDVVLVHGGVAIALITEASNA
jgi:hydrogenase maturation factor